MGMVTGRSQSHAITGMKLTRSGASTLPGLPTACAHCGRYFDPVARPGRRRRYCSDRCREAAYRARRAAERPNYGACVVEGCGTPRRSKSAPWCEMHYARGIEVTLSRTGDYAAGLVTIAASRPGAGVGTTVRNSAIRELALAFPTTLIVDALYVPPRYCMRSALTEMGAARRNALTLFAWLPPTD